MSNIYEQALKYQYSSVSVHETLLGNLVEIQIPGLQIWYFCHFSQSPQVIWVRVSEDNIWRNT